MLLLLLLFQNLFGITDISVIVYLTIYLFIRRKQFIFKIAYLILGYIMRINSMGNNLSLFQV